MAFGIISLKKLNSGSTLIFQVADPWAGLSVTIRVTLVSSVENVILEGPDTQDSRLGLVELRSNEIEYIEHN